MAEIYKNNLAFVAIIKNEAPYIREWILFHKMVGVDKFYIYDNDSEDNLYDTISDFVKDGLVEYTYFPGKCMQMPCYNDAISKHKDECKYMGFIDCDEFVIPVDSDTLLNILDKRINGNAKGLGINWRTYGSSGKKNMPEGLVIENYTYRSRANDDINKHIKTICDPRFVETFDNPHYPIYQDGYYSVDEEGKEIYGPFNLNNTVNRVRINHYFTKSLEEYIKKMNRGKADLLSYRSMHEFYERDKNEVYDYNLESYVSELKEQLNKGINKQY